MEAVSLVTLDNHTLVAFQNFEVSLNRLGERSKGVVANLLIPSVGHMRTLPLVDYLRGGPLDVIPNPTD